jgi:hypothetical protein
MLAEKHLPLNDRVSRRGISVPLRLANVTPGNLRGAILGW